nr:uncharacterized protein LOC109189671 [Ipomoea trifida]
MMDPDTAADVFKNLTLADFDEYEKQSLEGEAQQQERPFGPALRAGNRRNIPTTGEKWIAPESKADRKLWRTSGAGKSAESGGVKMANMHESGQSVPSTPLKKGCPETSGEHNTRNHVNDQPPCGSDSAQASGKEKDTVLADMDLGQAQTWVESSNLHGLLQLYLFMPLMPR